MGVGEMLGVVVTGLVVVFLALIILIIAVSVMGKIFQSTNNAKKNEQTDVKAQPKSAVAKPAVTQATAPVVEDGISDEVVAAITAAIACVMSADGETKPFAVRSIKRVREARNAWNMAGLVENTRPF